MTHGSIWDPFEAYLCRISYLYKCRCCVGFDPRKVLWGGQLIDPPDHNMPFEMIPLKLKVDTKHRLLMLNTCDVDEYFQNAPTDLRQISSQTLLGSRTTDLKS